MKTPCQISLLWGPHLVHRKYSSQVSPLRSPSGPWEILSHPSPFPEPADYLLWLSELCHQSITLCISFLLSQIWQFYSSGGPDVQVGFTELTQGAGRAVGETSEISWGNRQPVSCLHQLHEGYLPSLARLLPTPIITPPLILACLPFQGSFWLHWAHMAYPEWPPHLKILNHTSKVLFAMYSNMFTGSGIGM